jgi:hypothetical protein
MIFLTLDTGEETERCEQSVFEDLPSAKHENTHEEAEFGQSAPS